MAGKISRVARQRLDVLRAKIRRMDFEPLTDAQLEEAAEGDAEGRANNAISGLYATAEEDAFFQMLQEERVPVHLRPSLAIYFVLGYEPTVAAD